ncbi:MAG: M23 family metallopeptidase [Actinobacteria bacterium]|nr:M23 family metallopeptidase [Actinomycetota bacterium]
MTQASTGSNNYKFNNVQNNTSKITSKINVVFKSILLLLLFLCVLISFPSMVYPDCKSPFIIPIEGEIITGFRQSYLDTDKQRFLKHTGIDIKGKYGQKVAAAGNGIVSYIGFSPTGGRTLVIKHNQKIRTTYLNLMQIYVSTGTYVKQGEIIAAIGADDDPSNSQCHLHFGVIYDKKYLDPEDLLKINYSSISKFLYLKYLPSDFKLDYGNNTHK